jgi:hypothetical protein
MDGLILDLTDVDESEPFVWTDHIVSAPTEPTLDVVAFIKGMASKCPKCDLTVYYSIEHHKMCTDCWKAEKKENEAELQAFLDEQYKKSCEFCERKKVSDERFHFDHKNMFEKNNTVGNMIEHGCSKEELVAEIEKCQLLCYSCHSIVTKMEWLHGFMRKKRKCTMYNRKGTSPETEAIRKSLVEEYDSVMIPVYGLIRKIVKGEL